jgi:diguanylate cyclase (GGDEF)-like protein/PAS domain S-box-containing protein
MGVVSILVERSASIHAVRLEALPPTEVESVLLDRLPLDQIPPDILSLVRLRIGRLQERLTDENTRLTLQIQAQDQTIRQRDRLSRLSDELFAVLTPDGIVTHMTGPIERAMGLAPERFIHRSIFKYLPPERAEELHTLLKGLVTDGRPRTVEIHLRNFLGERIFELYGYNLLDDPDIHGIVVRFQDITGRKQAEIELQETNYQLEQVLVQATAMATEAEVRAHEAETLRRAGMAIATTLNPDEAIQRILEQLVQVIPFTSASVQLVRSDGVEIVACSGFQNPSEIIGTRFPIGAEHPSGQVILSRQALVLPDAPAASPDFHHPSFNHIRSWVGVPMIIHDQAIGVVALDSTELNQFSPRDAELAAVFADQVAIALENARLYQAAVRNADRMAVIYRISQQINDGLDLHRLYASIQQGVSEIMPCEAFVISLAEDNGMYYENVYMYDEGQVYPPIRREMARGIGGAVIRTGALFEYEDFTEEIAAQFGVYRYGNGSLPRSVIAVPLRRGDLVIGAISVQAYTPRAFNEGHRETLELLAAQAAIAIENARLFAETERLAITDGLTGLYNRRHFFNLASQEFRHALRYSRPITMILLDIDFFKKVNDQYGHPAGDQVLKVLANFLSNHLRGSDICGRYGGEEFAIFLPETGSLEAAQIAERLRAGVAELQVESSGGMIQITISVGVAGGNSQELGNLDQLVTAADNALYCAKNEGRNRVSTGNSTV